MSNLFPNILQFANPQINKTANGIINPAVSNIKEKGIIDFETLLASLSKPTPKSDCQNLSKSLAFPNVAGSLNFPLPNQQFMTVTPANSNQLSIIKEKATIDSQVLTVLISNQKDQIIIDIPQFKSTANSQFLSVDKNNNNQGNIFADPTLNIVGKSSIPNISSDINIRLTIKPSELFAPQFENGRTVIPATVSSQSGGEQRVLVDVSKLMNLLKEYPDPINMEISNVENIISAAGDVTSSQLSSSKNSSFIFDFRNLAETIGQRSRAQITGILKTAEKSSLTQSSSNNIVSDKTAQFQSEPANIAVNAQNAGQVSIIDPLPNIEQPNDNAVKISIVAEKSSLSTSGPEINNGIDIREANASISNIKISTMESSFQEISGISTELSEMNLDISNIDIKKTLKENQHSKIAQHSDNTPQNEKSIPINFHEDIEFGKAIKVKSHVETEQNLAEKNSAAGQNLQATTAEMPKADSLLAGTSEPKLPANAMSTRIEDIKSVIAAAIDKQMSSVKIRLQPENLGSVSIKMTWKNNDLSIGLTTENKDTAALLNSNLAQLKGGLESANLNIKEVHVTIDDRHQNGNFNSNQNQSNGSHGNPRQEQKSSNPSEFARQNQMMRAPMKAMIANLSSTVNPYGWIDLKA